MNILDRLREARSPYEASKVFEEARVHNACLDAEREIIRLQDSVITLVGALKIVAVGQSGVRCDK